MQLSLNKNLSKLLKTSLFKGKKLKQYVKTSFCAGKFYFTQQFANLVIENEF